MGWKIPRTATVLKIAGLLRRTRLITPHHAPVNYQVRDLKNLEADVTYALKNASVMMRLIEESRMSVSGLRVLELGPGTDFGAQLILASMGAHVTLADRYLAPWDDNYHPALYRALAARWDGPKLDLERAIAAGGYTGVLSLLEEPAERLQSIPDGSIDFLYSNAVLEHIYDLPMVVSEMARVLRVGGRAAHQIDMRDHRDFSQPINHLAMSDDEFSKIAKPLNFEFGNRYRSIEFWAHFENAGLRVTARDINSETAPAYKAKALRRVRKSRSSYRNWPAPDLTRVGGRFYLIKEEPGSAVAVKERARDALDLIEALKDSARPSP